MEITLIPATTEDAECIWRMQVEAFTPLYERYHDEISPALETKEHILEKLSRKDRVWYKIYADGELAGAINVLNMQNGRYGISPIFILSKAQNKGIAQRTMTLVEGMHPHASVWELFTILQEERNCYFYEKLGYRRVENYQEVVNAHMTLVKYEKEMHKQG